MHAHIHAGPNKYNLHQYSTINLQEIFTRSGQISSFDLFCVPIQKWCPEMLPEAPWMIMFPYLVCNKLQPHTKIKWNRKLNQFKLGGEKKSRPQIWTSRAKTLINRAKSCACSTLLLVWLLHRWLKCPQRHWIMEVNFSLSFHQNCDRHHVD